MINRKDFTIGILVVLCLTVMSFPNIQPIETKTWILTQTEQYDPWADINDDGEINILDLAYLGKRFRTSGDPINKSGLQEQIAEMNETVTLFEKQTREVFYFKKFTLYNYKTDEYWYTWYKVRSADYYTYRFDVETHAPAILNDRVTEELISKTTSSWSDLEGAVIAEMAYDLWQISQGDEEVFVNLAIQLVHQLCYNVTLYTKYPVETIVEESGDCDNLAVLTASILLAGGFDVVLLFVYADGGGHSMLGVSMTYPPDDLFDYGRTYRHYAEYEQIYYWLIEATWGDPGGINWIDPATSIAYNQPGAFVGDNPWEQIDIVSVIHPSAN